MRFAIAVLFLLITLIPPPYHFYSLIGWLGLATLLRKNPSLCVLCVFFTAPFYHPMGFAPNFIFTIKHFHIAVAITLIHQILEGRFIQHIRNAVGMIKPLYSFLALLALGIVVGTYYGYATKSIRILCNLGLVLFSCLYILGMLKDQKKLVYKGMGMALFAQLLKVLISYTLADVGNTWEGYGLEHNNLISLELAFYFFCMLALANAAKTRTLQITCWALTAFYLSGLFISVSRSVWLSLALASIYFLSQLKARANLNNVWNFFKKPLYAIAGFVGLFFAYAVLFRNDLRTRMIDTFDFLKPSEWAFAFQDTQNLGNFGFLGRHRGVLVDHLTDIFLSHHWLGVGFTPQVLNFHGIYFIMLGATGLVGLGLFVSFLNDLFRGLHRAMDHEADANSELWFLCLSTCLLVWCIGSVMQTIWIQFSFWILIISCLAVIDMSKQNSSTEKEARVRPKSSEELSAIPCA